MQMVFQKGWTSLHSVQQWMSANVSYIHTRTTCSWNLWCGIRWFLIIVMICFSLKISCIEHFMCLWPSVIESLSESPWLLLQSCSWFITQCSSTGLFFRSYFPGAKILLSSYHLPWLLLWKIYSYISLYLSLSLCKVTKTENLNEKFE